MRRLKLPGRDVTRPRLGENDIRLIQEVGIDGMKEQARRIAEKKLRRQPENDGNQTPLGGNPVYKAMHACNTASRKELSMSHRIPEDKKLTDSQVSSVVDLVTRWIAREYNFYMQEKEQQQRGLGEFS